VLRRRGFPLVRLTRGESHNGQKGQDALLGLISKLEGLFEEWNKLMRPVHL
jgi:hypothetical protein